VLKSLQSRLTVSYIVVVAVSLLLAGLAALVLLRGYQRNLAFVGLSDRSLLAARLTANAIKRGQSPRLATGRVAQTMARRTDSTVSLYLLDGTGSTVAGSDKKLEGLRLEDLVFEGTSFSDWPKRGEYRGEGGSRILYVAEPLARPADTDPRIAEYVLLLAQPYRPIVGALTDLLPRLLWVGAVALALSVLVAALMAYSVSRPVERISRAAEEIAAGNYDQELFIATPTEVARLATSFTTMASRVKAALLSQQDLVANVSHELKTPLTSIQGFSQALVDGTAGDQVGRQRAAAIIHEEAGRMRRLVDELLDLARLEGGQVELAREPIETEQLLRACAARFGPQAEERNITLSLKPAPGLPPVIGDQDRLGQVLDNLVDNALKHPQSATGSATITLEAGLLDDWIVLSVIDNGPGIPAEDLPRVFERFYRADKSRARGGKGAGLGLAIAQEIVQAHGGQMLVESVEGLGTRFTVRLPARSSRSGGSS
jgi:signal transduction histidine kinase